VTFARGSRYERVPDGLYTARDGRQIRYKRLRTFPAAAPAQGFHAVAQGDRLDLISYDGYRDPEQYWRICDANGALRPDDLLAVVGRRLAIPVALD